MSSEPDFLSVEDVLLLHQQQLARYGGGAGLRDAGALDSAIAMPQATIEVQVSEGDSVDVSANKGMIVIRPSRRTYSLQELVDAITPRNRHKKADWGSPVGHEAW